MAEDGMLISPTRLQDTGGGDINPAGEHNMDMVDGLELSLEEILTLYNQPINEEQAWAVCYQCCRTLAQKHQARNCKSPDAPVVHCARRIEGLADIRVRRDGAVRLQCPDNTGDDTDHTDNTYRLTNTSQEVIESLGIMIYKALDYSLNKEEERDLSPPLEQLILMMTSAPEEAESDPCPDEGYEATEEEDEGDGEEDPKTPSDVKCYRDIINFCTSHLPSPSDAPNHYQAVCRALYSETWELRSFLEKIKSHKENLRKMEVMTGEEPLRDLNELQNDDWARFWVQVMRDLRHGVKLKKVQERQYNPLAIEFQLTPYEMLMDDIRSKRYKLRKVMEHGDIPPRLKKSAHEVIMEFIRSRPPLNPVASRKLKPHPPRPRSLHERLLEDIKAERKLRPVSPDMIRRNRLGAGKSFSTPQDLFRGSDQDIVDVPRKMAVSSLSLANGSGVGGAVGVAEGGHCLTQRKRLLKAPTLAELGSSDSDDDLTMLSPTSSTMSPMSLSMLDTSTMSDMSPESAIGTKSPPKFLSVSSVVPTDRRSLQRRHSIEKETPTSTCIRPFLLPSKQGSKSLLTEANTKEEFCYPVECLALTVEEVMHIRQVLVKAELEKFQQYKDIYTALKKGKICFSCRAKRFSFFTWAYTCQFCKRPVCSQCCKKMRLPSKPYTALPIYSLGPSAPAREEAGPAEAPAQSEHSASGSGPSQNRHSLRRTPSNRSIKHSGNEASGSRDEAELPKELTEDWSTMEVCVDCKKFISEIISSSKRSLSLATKRARLKRKTQSFHSSSPKASDYRPSERTISEV